MAVGADDDLIGRTIDGRYVVRELLGRGGMGAVYVAEHLALGKRIAIKVMLPDDDGDASARFRREAQAASQIAHEHVVHVIDVGSCEGLDYLVMELVDGKDLQRVLEEQGPFAVERATAIARQLLLALEAIHAAGLVHRDIKPANVLITPRGGEDFVKLTDFGIAKTLRVGDDTVTKTGRIVGTPQYMAPEQLAGMAADERSDIYAAGLVVFAMLTGDLPASAFSRVAEPGSGHAPKSLDDLRAGLPRGLVTAVERALSPAPNGRFQSARAFRDALDGKPEERRPSVVTVAAKPRGREEVSRTDEGTQTTRGPRAWRAGALLGVAAVAIAAGVIAFAIRNRQRTPPTAGSASSGSAAILDHASRAREAERAGKLELAIAEYHEDLASRASADGWFHLGELSERLGRREEAASYYEHYLAAAPAAADRDLVLARLAELRSRPVAADAGIALDATTRTPASERPARAAVRIGAARDGHTDQRCECTSNSAGSLCSHLTPTLRCWCQADDTSELCASLYTPDGECSATIDGRGVKRGAPCTGHPPGVNGSVETREVAGTYACSWCASIFFEGHLAEPCTGYDPSDGKSVDSSHFTNCR